MLLEVPYGVHELKGLVAVLESPWHGLHAPHIQSAENIFWCKHISLRTSIGTQSVHHEGERRRLRPVLRAPYSNPLLACRIHMTSKKHFVVS